MSDPLLPLPPVLEVPRTVPSVIACPLCPPDSELGLLDS